MEWINTAVDFLWAKWQIAEPAVSAVVRQQELRRQAAICLRSARNASRVRPLPFRYGIENRAIFLDRQETSPF